MYFFELNERNTQRFKDSLEGRTVAEVLIGEKGITLVFTDNSQFNVSLDDNGLHFGSWKQCEWYGLKTE